MIVSGKLQGGLGNCLWIISAIISYSLKHNIQYRIPKTIINPHYPDQKVFASPYLKYFSEQFLEMQGRIEYYYEPYFHYAEIPKFDCDVLILSGYFQSVKHIDPYKEEVFKILNIPYEFKKDKCAICVRRGDYLNLPGFHPVVSNIYLQEAQIKMMNNGIGKFEVYSDDIEWCKNYMPQFDNADYEFSEGKTDTEDLALASSCENQICSNSSFSFWSYYLNKNENKIGIFPKKDRWFGKALSHDVSDLYLPEMVLI